MRDTIEYLLESPQGDVALSLTISVDAETYPAEPYSWGGSRGMEASASVTIRGAMLGGLGLTRRDLSLWVGEARVKRIEADLAEVYAQAELMA